MSKTTLYNHTELKERINSCEINKKNYLWTLGLNKTRTIKMPSLLLLKEELKRERKKNKGLEEKNK
ncbi:hypothetical protein MKX31_13780 [Bacillus sp. FSL M8-0063]|uniref:hypothetical protein n=1 Tax=Bacillus TaxID=1386 RepID=UPI001F5118F0|nr:MULTISPECIES: hypothetical protein [Bacillus]MCR6847781.1 hypothetical protein [Bacillus sp. IBL03825]MCU5114539.1 hypothetical protein [Bacillus wiedmannii]MCU5154348.1 hypothetical protein [Bacillus wiedmannii]MCU5414146.1 hypothetical protein [Bacillus wiedmannii]MED3615157.1 hypothetical protein [Bacillus wiedmannii]